MKFLKIEMSSNSKKELELLTKELLKSNITNKINILKSSSYTKNKIEDIYISTFIIRSKSINNFYDITNNKNIEIIISEVEINNNYKNNFLDSTNTPIFL